MAEIQLNINNKPYTIDVDPDTPLLWILRDTLGMVGTKYGCGIVQCGACTVHVNGRAVLSCGAPVGSVEGTKITTIEGLSEHGDHPVQQAWMEIDVPQCGYCQAGQIMSATALLSVNPQPADDDIDRMMSGNICRCCTYNRIRKAVHLAAEKMRG